MVVKSGHFQIRYLACSGMKIMFQINLYHSVIFVDSKAKQLSKPQRSSYHVNCKRDKKNQTR